MPVSTFLIGPPDQPRLYSLTDGVKRPPPPNIPLQDVITWAEYAPIWKNRGKAIQAYAELESALCYLLKTLGEMSWEVAVTVFYKITSTAARNAILERLLHKKCGSKFNLFWNPYVKELRTIDLKRNAIVHWVAAANCLINSEGQIVVGVNLIPPASIHNRTPVPEYITPSDLVAFATKCDEFARLVTGLAGRVDPKVIAEEGEPWLDIYQLPLVYPLPEGHPIIRKPQEPEIHPRSFPESLQFLREVPGAQLLERWDP